nr:phosphoesterase [Xanthomonadales bacterium]
KLFRRGTSVTRRCFLSDGRRVILPAFGTYTGGLDVLDRAFDHLVGADANAWLLGKRVTAIARARLRK